jgi:hypothetical protein
MENRRLACAVVLPPALPFTAGGRATLAVTSVPASVDGVFADKECSFVTEAAGGAGRKLAR